MPETDQCRTAILSEDYQDFIVGYYNRKDILEEMQADCYQVVSPDYAVIHVYRPFYNGSGMLQVTYAQLPKCYGLLQQETLEEIGVNRLRRMPGFDYGGQGVLIGLVDTGIDYRHPAFLRADGTSRVVAIWDQNDQSGEPPRDFAYGTEFGTEQIAEGSAPGDENGHGTFLAGIAAGKSDASEGFYGVAPLADLAVVKLKEAKTCLRRFYLLPEDVPAYSEGDIMLGVRYLLELAERRNQPLILLLGLGSNAGNHTGNLPLSRYLTTLSYRLDLCIVLAGGNEGSARHHFHGEISRERQEVELQIGRENGFVMELWTSTIARLRFALISPSGERVELPTGTPFYTQQFSLIFDRTSVSVRYERQERSSGGQVLVFRFAHPAAGIWRIAVDGSEERSAVYDLWLPMERFLGEDTFFLSPDPEITLCEPANAPLPIAVAGYNPSNGGLYPASSRGFTASGQIKPTFAGPAVNAIGPRAGGGYVKQSGTSIAAAYAAGCIALFFEYILDYRARRARGAAEQGYDLSLDTVLLRDLFASGAVRDDSITYPNPAWGYGKLNLYGVFELLRMT